MSLFDPVVSTPAGATLRSAREAHAAGRAIERLPFTIRRVETEADLLKAVAIRHAAYARHVPEFARSLALPEPADYDDDTIVLLAESKLDGTALGSTRIRTNLYRPLGVEASVTLPDWLQGRRLVEATRLGIDEGRVGRMVKLALIKACFMYCEDYDIDYSVATGRPPVDRQYEQMLFTDVFPEQGLVPLRHVGNIPHRVMAFEIASFEQRYTEAKHPLLNFFFNTHHPDIDVGTPAPSPVASAPRAGVVELSMLQPRVFAFA
ncbi:MAG: N-acyl amino acid synthase FeeM domain-containing protein [Telluria sp.]